MNAPDEQKPRTADIAAEMAHRQLVRDTLGEWWERLAGAAATWDLETVKHLVVLNAAGFAGVATLITGSKSLQPTWIGPVALLGYGFGVVSAILNMHLGAVSFEKMAGEINQRIKSTWNPSNGTDGIYDSPKAGRWQNIAGQVCGWTSAALAVGSTLALGLSLVK